MTAATERYATRAAFFLTLARAFAPPKEPALVQAFAEDLALDLEEMADELGYDLGDAPVLLRAAMASLEGPEALLRLYSGLFLTPPVPVHLDAAIYLDGAALGHASFEIEQWYARHGYVRQAAFHDLADHVTAQLEFVFLLFNRAAEAMLAGESMQALALAAEARRFLAAFPRRWIQGLRPGLEQTCRERGWPPVYLALAQALEAALAAEIAQDPSTTPEAAVSALPAGSNRGFGEPTAEDLAEIAVRLEENGLAFDHVRARPEWDETIYERRKAVGPAAS
jgi:TorA maturation chaperone TorD